MKNRRKFCEEKQNGLYSKIECKSGYIQKLFQSQSFNFFQILIK